MEGGCKKDYEREMDIVKNAYTMHNMVNHGMLISKLKDKVLCLNFR